MLTRLRVRGFKNLVDVDLGLGPVTCIAGLNASGKSNFFDAVHFLGLLADHTFIEAASKVRGGDDPLELRTGRRPGEIELIAEMLIPREGFDLFGQRAEASATMLEYCLKLDVADDPEMPGRARFTLISESLTYIPKGQAKRRLGFPLGNEFIESAVVTQRTTSFIRTEDLPSTGAVIYLQSDRSQGENMSKRGGGKSAGFRASQLPRTVLSSAQNAEETRTAVLVRQEMRRWRQLQLEPTALRSADDFQSSDYLDSSGSHVAATLYRLTRTESLGDADAVYAKTANRLATLIEGVRSVRVNRDEARRQLRFMMCDEHGLELPAGSLSDGTLRFVALSILQQDPRETGLICLEEPENGIHPERIGAMIDLLYDIAVDPKLPVDETNPLRQVLLTTHSPRVVGEMFSADLVFSGVRLHHDAETPTSGVEFRPLTGQWRAQGGAPAVSRDTIVRYLAGGAEDEEYETREQRVRDSLQMEIRFGKHGGT
jgi:predicted ATPase